MTIDDKELSMKKLGLILLVVAFIAGFTMFSYAQGRNPEGVQNINQRIRIANDGIERGIRSGALTREEAHALRKELDYVHNEEARMRADGRLNYQERQRLDQELDRLERHIASLKQNAGRSTSSGSGRPNDPFTGITYIPAGPIWNDSHARTRCPEVCSKFGGWDQSSQGSWYTTIPGRMSVCRCNIDSGLQTIMAPGTIWE
jgi:hypothetical protein